MWWICMVSSILNYKLLFWIWTRMFWDCLFPRLGLREPWCCSKSSFLSILKEIISLSQSLEGINAIYATCGHIPHLLFWMICNWVNQCKLVRIILRTSQKSIHVEWWAGSWKFLYMLACWFFDLLYHFVRTMPFNLLFKPRCMIKSSI